ncbi:MAG: HAD-IIB family hydrolase [Patescibacteria group bacterium]
MSFCSHIFFDLDNTLTRSRSLITPHMQKALFSLTNVVDVIIVSGAEEAQIKKQLTPIFDKALYLLAQNGNHAVHKNSELLWRHFLNETQKKEASAHIQNLKLSFKEPDVIDEDTIQDRGCQIAYSVIGHTAPVSRKEMWDPSASKRAWGLTQNPFVSETLEVRIGGTTCFDYFEKGRNKGKNINDLLARFGWRENECLYVGDALYIGGNDETVVGVIPHQSVLNPSETLVHIQEILKRNIVQPSLKGN